MFHTAEYHKASLYIMWLMCVIYKSCLTQRAQSRTKYFTLVYCNLLKMCWYEDNSSHPSVNILYFYDYNYWLMHLKSILVPCHQLPSMMKNCSIVIHQISSMITLVIHTQASHPHTSQPSTHKTAIHTQASHPHTSQPSTHYDVSYVCQIWTW